MLLASRTERQQQTSVRTLDSLSVVCAHIGGLDPYVSIKRTFKSWSLMGVMCPLKCVVLAL